MPRVELEIPEWLADELGSTDSDHLQEALARGAKDLRMEESLKLLRRGPVTLGRAADLAGVTHQEMALFARSRGVEPFMSEESIREELRG